MLADELLLAWLTDNNYVIVKTEGSGAETVSTKTVLQQFRHSLEHTEPKAVTGIREVLQNRPETILVKPY
jgi:hypothetical protein